MQQKGVLHHKSGILGDEIHIRAKLLCLCIVCVLLLWITLWITFSKKLKKLINKGVFIVDNYFVKMWITFFKIVQN